MGPVLGVGGNAYQLAEGAFARDHGWGGGPDRVRHYTAVLYRHVRLTTTNNDLAGIDVVHPAEATVLGTAVAAGGSRTPGAVQADKLTYVSEVPLGSRGSRDRSFARADLMAGMFRPAQQR